VNDAMIREMQSTMDAGEEPIAIVEPCQIVSFDLQGIRSEPAG
jgi:hypothetical protein